MKKNILLVISALLLLFTTAIPFCVLVAVKQPITGAQKGLIACLMIAGYVGSYLYYIVHKEASKKGPQTF